VADVFWFQAQVVFDEMQEECMFFVGEMEVLLGKAECAGDAKLR